MEKIKKKIEINYLKKQLSIHIKKTTVKMSEVNESVAQRAESNANLKMLSGVHTGQVKWFNRRRGYGFIKIIQSRENESDNHESFIGKDVFVHQSHIKPQKSTYRSLEENEYVELGLSVDDKNVTQAVNVTGILGGSLLCDVQHERPARTGPGGHGSSDDGESEGREFRTPKYHQRRGRNFRGSRHHSGRRGGDSGNQESATTSESAQGNSESQGRRGNYFAGLDESQ